VTLGISFGGVNSGGGISWNIQLNFQNISVIEKGEQREIDFKEDKCILQALPSLPASSRNSGSASEKTFEF
jgi:hypothetical protein